MIDNSTQLLTSNLNSNILYSVQASSNTYTLLSLFNNSNTYYSNQLLLKQNILTASTSLLGDGSAITNLDYNKIALNKPSYFPADWNTTIANKPTIYTQTEVNNLLSAKEQNLTFNAPLTRTTNTIGINLNSYTPFSALLQSNYATYTGLSASNYITNSTTSLTNYTRTGLDDAYLLKTGGTMTGVLTLPNNSWSIKTADNIDRMYFNNGGTTYFHSGNTNGNGFTFRSTAQVDIMTLTDSGALTATSFSGNGASLTNLAYTNITGKPTNFQSDWNSTIINKPTYFTPDPTLYYNQTQINNISNFNSNFTTQQSNILNTNIINSANTKQNILTGATNLLGIGSSITALDYTKITLNKPTNFQSDWNSTIINKPSTFPADMTTIYTKTETNNLLNAKEAILTFSSPLTRTTNTIGINLSTYSTTGTDPNFLKLIGGTLTGDFNIEKANPIVSIKSSAENQSSIFYLSTPLNITSGLKTAIISQGLSAWGRSKLHFCLNDNQTDNSTAQNASVSHARMTIQPNGYVGINTTTPPCRFTIKMGYSDGNTAGLSIDSTDVTNTYNLRIYSYVQAGSQVGYKFEVNNIASSVNAIILNYNGSVNIGNLQIAGYDSHYYLFNNTGGTHGDITDFNNITTFGYKFVQATTNSPNTGGGQYYAWSIGLGANYPYSQYVCQFGIPRNITNPTLSVRFRENGSWGGWSGITAGKLNGTAILAVDNWIYDSDNRQRFYFGTNGRTYYQGYPSTNISHEFRGSAGTAIFTLTDGGSAVFSGSITAKANSSISGDLSLFNGTGGGTGAFYCAGNLTCTMGSVDSYGNDYLGVANTSAGGNTQYSRTLYIMFNTFTGFHRCFTKDPLYDNENPQKFKDDYMGRIVVSTGKIATDMKTNDEWEIKYDKEGITIEDALPEIELSRTRKNKRVFGVLGLSKRGNSRPERMIVNSVGEGGIWICNSNGNIENGDYITSSDYLGYGEKQDDDLLHNYTCAKATMDCDFELDSPLYECKEIEGGIRVAFISSTYHCG